MKIIKVKRFSLRVYDAVLKLIPQLAPDAKLPSGNRFKTILKSEGIFFFIAELENKHIVGSMTICSYITPTGTKVWIEDVVVDKSQRGKGYGKELIIFAIAFARSLGAEKIGLTSRPSRTEANKLYRKLGFVIRETNVYEYSIMSQPES